MPPRKSDVSKAATGDEGTPAKETPVRDGINVEVRYKSLRLRLPTHAPLSLCPVQRRPHVQDMTLIQLTGFEPAKEHSDAVSEGCAAAKYTDPGKRNASHDQERDSLCELPSLTVRPPPSAHPYPCNL